MNGKLLQHAAGDALAVAAQQPIEKGYQGNPLGRVK
jgi:hypothetical protein